mmetsp:Transcript_14366/g.28903  ORF Transcript_14366/g.28903 Transcript_14366/m.28903 type:complete len:200 (-) Transcript_14366:50-649(-)
MVLLVFGRPPDRRALPGKASHTGENKGEGSRRGEASVREEAMQEDAHTDPHLEPYKEIHGQQLGHSGTGNRGEKRNNAKANENSNGMAEEVLCEDVDGIIQAVFIQLSFRNLLEPHWTEFFRLSFFGLQRNNLNGTRSLQLRFQGQGCRSNLLCVTHSGRRLRYQKVRVDLGCDPMKRYGRKEMRLPKEWSVYSSQQRR